MKHSTLLTLALPALTSALVLPPQGLPPPDLAPRDIGPTFPPPPVLPPATFPQPGLQPSTAAPQRFTGHIDPYTSGAVTNHGTIQAVDGRFWIGRQPNINCPQDTAGVQACQNSQNSQTNFVYYQNTHRMSLDSMVPGGQQIYVNAATGRLRFTGANNGVMDGTPVVQGFLVVAQVLQFEHRDWMACGSQATGYGIWAASRMQFPGSGSDGPCFPFIWRMQDAGLRSAWQYN